MKTVLKTIRIFLALLSFLAVALLFIDVTGYAAGHWGWMAKMQLIPAILALNIGVVALLIIITLIFGRVYCSVICPLGIYQDIVNRLHVAVSSKKNRTLGRFRHSKPLTSVRYIFLGIFILLFTLGFLAIVPASIAGLLDPYSSFGRMATWLARPASLLLNNALADMDADHGSYVFATIEPSPISIALLIVSAATFIVVSVMAWVGGRIYCNTVCPVGTLLGLISRYAWLRPIIDTDKCTRCGSCGRKCKAQCIDTKLHKIDLSRCVACMDCLSVCKEGAISYTHQAKASNNADSVNQSGRRAFLVGGAIIATGLADELIAKSSTGALTPLKDKKPALRDEKVIPPGARSAIRLANHCTACQLCISACPNNVLRPSTSISTFMQPTLEFNQGWCRPECTACSDVCPTGAIESLDIPTKASTKIGTAVVDLSACISAAYGQACGNCSRKCPAGAITMISMQEDGGNLRPLVDAERCIGCGSCEYHCPVGTANNIRAERAAIHVEGHNIHREI